MHSISPVRIRFENHIKNPMVSTNFEDLTTMKAKKRVKIGPSTIMNETSKEKVTCPFTSATSCSSSKRAKTKIHTKKVIETKSRSLSPRNRPKWCPVSNSNSRHTRLPNRVLSAKSKQNKLDLDFEQVPVRDTCCDLSRKDSKNLASKCQVCVEAKARSKSPLKNNTHNLNSSFSSSSAYSSSDCSIIDEDCTNVRKTLASSSNPNLTKSKSVSPHSPRNLRFKCNSQESFFDPNLTYCLPSNRSSVRSRSCDDNLETTRRHVSSHLDATRLPHPPPISLRLPVPPLGFLPPYFYENIINHHEILFEKLVESEAQANRIAHHVSLFKEFLRNELNLSKQNVNLTSINNLENEREELIEQIERFEMTNRHLRDIVYDLTCSQPTLDSLEKQQVKDNSSHYLRQIDILEVENNKLRKTLHDLEKKINLSGTTNEALNMENNALTNIKLSLEDNRAHLRRQLLARESEVNRLNVQIRNITRKFDRSQMEIKLLRESRERAGLSSLKFLSNGSEETNQIMKANKLNINDANKTQNIKLVQNGPKLTKNYFNLEEILNDPLKIRLYIDKLNNQLREKDAVIKNLNETVLKKSDDARPNENEKNEKPERLVEKLRKENDKLQIALKVKENKLKSAEEKLKTFDSKQRQAHSSNTLNSSKKPVQTSANSISSSDEATTSNFMNTHSQFSSSNQKRTANNQEQNSSSILIDKNTSTSTKIERLENFSQMELDQVRSRLQERLNELEPLPELLKNTELKLHESVSKMKQLERENSDLKKVINELKNEFEIIQSENKESTKTSIHKKQKHNEPSQTTNVTNFNNYATNLDSVEKRLQCLEDENKNLIRQLGLKDDLVSELNNKLSNKTNEASSLNRQLDLALNDANLKEQQLKDKLNSKERSLLAKCIELETKLNSVKLHSTYEKRDNEDLVHDYVAQIKDLKARLEQTQATNKQMQEYVNFLKNSYVAYFNDNSLHAFDNGAALSNNSYGFGQNFF